MGIPFFSVPVTLQTFFGGQRMLGSISVDVIINESTTDALTITKQPVQTGASITDHSFLEPTELSMTANFRNNGGTASLRKIYQQILDLQSTREPFTVTTPKRIYKDMLISALGNTTDKSTENILSLHMTLQQVILVKVGTVTVPPKNQRIPQKTQATQPAGKKSGLLTGASAIPGLENIPGFLKANP